MRNNHRVNRPRLLQDQSHKVETSRRNVRLKLEQKQNVVKIRLIIVIKRMLLKIIDEIIGKMIIIVPITVNRLVVGKVLDRLTASKQIVDKVLDRITVNKIIVAKAMARTIVNSRGIETVIFKITVEMIIGIIVKIAVNSSRLQTLTLKHVRQH